MSDVEKQIDKFFKLSRTEYILDANRNVIPVTREERLAWSINNNLEPVIVKQETVLDITVSTVFIGIDHNVHFKFDDDDEPHKPHIFETAIFNPNGDLNDIFARYSTWDEAVAGHNEAVQWVKDGCPDDE